MIKNPYELEYSFACSFFVAKKDTVRGIIGNTHGVNNAAKPLKTEIKNQCECWTCRSITTTGTIQGINSIKDSPKVEDLVDVMKTEFQQAKREFSEKSNNY